MRRSAPIFIIAIAGLLLVLYNNCGRPLQISRSSSDQNANTTRDFYKLETATPGPVVSLEVSPALISIFIKDSEVGKVNCRWEDLLSKGVSSLAQIGGMEWVTFSLVGGVCHLGVRDGAKSAVLQRDLSQIPQTLCFSFEGAAEVCQKFLQNQLPVPTPEVVEGLLRAPIQNARLFDSQNG